MIVIVRGGQGEAEMCVMERGASPALAQLDCIVSVGFAWHS